MNIIKMIFTTGFIILAPCASIAVFVATSVIMQAKANTLLEKLVSTFYSEKLPSGRLIFPDSFHSYIVYVIDVPRRHFHLVRYTCEWQPLVESKYQTVGGWRGELRDSSRRLTQLAFQYMRQYCYDITMTMDTDDLIVPLKTQFFCRERIYPDQLIHKKCLVFYSHDGSTEFHCFITPFGISCWRDGKTFAFSDHLPNLEFVNRVITFAKDYFLRNDTLVSKCLLKLNIWQQRQLPAIIKRKLPYSV
jgi:hypothetical protein